MPASKLIKASPEEREAFGERLEEARTAAGFKSQADLAEAVGVRPQTVQVWASGGSMPKAQKLEEVARALRVSENWLLTGSQSTSDEEEARSHARLQGVAFEREFEGELVRLGRKERLPTEGSVEIGGVEVKVDFLSPDWVLEIKHIRSPSGLEDFVSSALWRLAVIMSQDRWLGINRTYFLALTGPGLGGSGAERKLAGLEKQAEIIGIQIVRNPEPRELAREIHRLEEGYSPTEV